MTLARYIQHGSVGYGNVINSRVVFSDETEKSLAEHMKALADCFHGLIAVKCRQLAYW